MASPDWHEDVLKERNRRIADGEESYLDWDDVKKQLQDLYKPIGSKVVVELKKAQ